MSCATTANDIQAVSDAVLDFEYLKILRIMKPYITCIMNSHYIELISRKRFVMCIMNSHYVNMIRHWLEKLSDPTADKIQRNVYLFQLGRQVEDGHFSEPFLDPPTNAPLKPYQEQWGDVLAEERDIKESDMEEEEKVLWQYFPFTKSSLTYTAWNNDLENTKRTNKFFQQLNSKTDDDLNQLESAVIPKLNNISHGFNNVTCQNERNNSLKTDRQTTISPVTNNNQTTENPHKTCSSKDKLNEMKEKLDKFEANVLNIQQDIQVAHRRKKLMTKINNNIEVSNYVAQNPELFRLNLASLNQPRTPLKKDEESSWYDMSEGSTNITRQGSGDAPVSTRVQIGAAQSQKVAELLEIIDELRSDNFLLGQQLEKCTKYNNAQNAATKLSIQNLVEEVASLKNRLQELLDIKSNMQNNHLVVSSNLQANITNLHKRLKKMQLKNQDLKLVITALEGQLKEEHDKNERLSKDIKSKISISAFKELEQRLTETITKKDVEISDLSIKYDQDILQNQNNFQIELIKLKNERYDAEKTFNDQARIATSSFDSKIMEVRESYERNIVDMKDEFRSELNCKENEIERLESLVQDQCGRMRSEVQQIRQQLEEANKAENEEHFLEKIDFLQKCILKMEKLYLKSEKDFHKQLNKLKKDLEMRDRQNQLQLHTQKAGFITNKNAANLSDIDSIINKLEKYYKQLILSQQEEATDNRRRDAKVILDLREQLLRFSSVCALPEKV